MRDVRAMAFGGGGLDRAAHLRVQPKALAAHPARVLPFWRGRPGCVGDAAAQGVRLVQVPPDHPALDGAREAPVFLGLLQGKALFAQDISHWQPDGSGSEPQAHHDTKEVLHPALDPGARLTDLRGVMTALSPLEAELAATGRALLNWHRSHRFCAACGQASTPVQFGWQRRCPGCGTPHFPRTDPVVIMLVTRGNAVLLGRAPGWPEGMYSLLAGFVEPGETIEAAVRREVFEEVGLRIGRVGYLTSQPWPFPASLMIGCRAEALDSRITLDPVELDDARWVTREELLDAFAGHTPQLRPARKGTIARVLLRNWLADRLD